jgi:hypothetical protein
MRSEPWWVCNKCEKPIAKSKKKGVKEKMLEHRKECHELACFGIVQIFMSKKKKQDK